MYYYSSSRWSLAWNFICNNILRHLTHFSSACISPLQNLTCPNIWHVLISNISYWYGPDYTLTDIQTTNNKETRILRIMLWWKNSEDIAARLRNQRKSIGDDWTQQTPIRGLMKRKIKFAGHILRCSESDAWTMWYYGWIRRTIHPRRNCQRTVQTWLPRLQPM